MYDFTIKKSIIIEINNTKRAFVLLLLLLLFSAPFHGRDYYFQTLGSSDGLSQSSAISIWQDGIGRMWIGNDALNCYNGESVKVFRVSEYFKQLEDSYIHAFCGNDSVLFFLAEDQLLEMNLNLETFTLPGVKTTAICYCDNGLYYVSNNQLCVYDSETKKSKSIANLSLDRNPTCIYAINKEEFWIGTYSGLFRVDTKKKEAQKTYINGESIVFLHKDLLGNMLVGTQSNQLYMINTSSQIIHLRIEDKRHMPIFLPDLYSIAEESNGTIWLGTLAGVFQLARVADDPTVLVAKSQMIKESTVYSLFIDHQSSLWIGSYYGDVRYFNPQANDYVYYSVDDKRKDSLHGVVMGAMAEDKNGNLYIATEGSGINIIRPESDVVEHLTASDGLPKNKIRDLYYDEKNSRLYISVYMEGVCYLDLGTNKIRKVDDGDISNLYQRIIERIIPYKKSLLLLTQDGIFELNRETQRISYLFNDKKMREACSGIIRTIHVDDRNVLWVSSYKSGLFTVDLNTNKIIRNYGDGLSDESVIPSGILRINGDLQRGLYFTTLKSGVLAYDSQKDVFVSIDEASRNLISDICYNVTFLNDGTLVVTTNKGFTFLKMASPLQVKTSKHVRIDPSFPLKALSADCGLFVSPSSGRIYIGGLYGMISFYQSDLQDVRADYNLYLSSIMVNNTPLSLTEMKESFNVLKKIVLPYDENTLNITFASSDYLYSHAISYEYKLEGLDDYWTETIHNTIVYNSLRPGKYKLIIREVDDIDKQVEVPIEIKAPFWASSPAIIIYVYLILLLLWWVIRFYMARAMLRNSLEMERRELVRVEESNRNKMDFFINVSNEFRTPLTLIVAQLDRLSYELSGGAKTKIDKIKKQALRLQDLISELLDFRKMGQQTLRLNVRDYNYSEFLSEIIEIFRDQASEKHVSYRFVSDEDMYVWFDKKQMQKVFYNILTFVFKTVSERDSVQITLRRKSKNAEVAIVVKRNKSDDSWVDSVLEIINSDVTALSDLSLLPEGATGLVFSKAIVGLHKGVVEAKKNGSELLVLLELQLGNAHLGDVASENDVIEESSTIQLMKGGVGSTEEFTYSSGLSIKKSVRMLLVEDDDEMRRVLKESFSLMYDVSEMRNGNEAYDYAVRELPDIILSDVDISGISGIELCAMLKENKNTLHIPVILVSARPSEKQNMESIRSGADDYFVKPFNIEQLFLRCNALVANRKKMLSSKKEYKESPEMATNMRDLEFLTQANKILEANYANQDFDTTFWSKELGIGRTRLFNKIKEITGMTPNDYILFMKMNKSQVLLQKEGVTVAEVAYQMGFANPAYFSKSFKKQFGITPMDYRRKLD